MTAHTKRHPHAAPGAVQILLAGSRGREELLMGGRLLVRTPHGLKPPDRLLLQAADAFPGERVLTLAMNLTVPALALAAVRSSAAVTFYHFDLFRVRQAESQAGGHRLQNFQALCEPDLPVLDPGPDLLLAEFRTDGEAGLTLELIHQAHDRLAPGGKMLAVINNPRDQWLRHQIEKTFGNLTQVDRDKHAIVYSAKRTDHTPAPAEDQPTPRTHFIKHVDVKFGEWEMQFETCYGTFSSDSLDEGSRALLDVLVPPEPCPAILDLGSGWGGLGLLAAKKANAQRLVMIDSNARAVGMARRNVARFGPPEVDVRLEADVESVQSGALNGQFDLVVANPPYGTEYRVLDLFIDAAWRALRPGGSVWVVGKNNPRMVAKMEEVFGAAELLRRRGYGIVKALRPSTRRYE